MLVRNDKEILIESISVQYWTGDLAVGVALNFLIKTSKQYHNFRFLTTIGDGGQMLLNCEEIKYHYFGAVNSNISAPARSN